MLAGYTANTTPKTSTGILTVGGSPTNTATLIVNSAGGGSFVIGDATFATGEGIGIFNLNTNATALVYTSINKSSTAGATNIATINITGSSLMVTNGTFGAAAFPLTIWISPTRL